MTDTLTPTKTSLRAEQRQATRTRILDAALAVLKTGELCTMRSVARSAGVSERTIYRHFESLGKLTTAVREHLGTLTSMPLPERGHELVRHTTDLFTRFETHRSLLTTLVSGSTFDSELVGSRRRDLVQMRAFIGCNFPTAPLDDRRAAAASLHCLLSIPGWVYLRASCGLANDEIIRSTQWTIQTVLARLRV